MPDTPWAPLPDPDDGLFVPLSGLTFERAPAIPWVTPEGLVQPRLVIDPQIPAADRRVLTGLPPDDLIPLSIDVPQPRRGRRFRPWAAQGEAADVGLAPIPLT